jgi:hypothetical protein
MSDSVSFFVENAYRGVRICSPKGQAAGDYMGLVHVRQCGFPCGKRTPRRQDLLLRVMRHVITRGSFISESVARGGSILA